MAEETTTPAAPTTPSPKVKEFLEVVAALGEAVENELPEEKYYLEQYLKSEFGIDPYVPPATDNTGGDTTTPAAPADNANAASGDGSTPATPADPNATAADPNAPTG